MNNETDLTEATKELAKNTASLARDHIPDEIDTESISKVAKAIFEGIFEAIKKVF